ncbi:hypothetical protein GCM10007148_10910 [Parvularcula lutaonensis]|nr:hypothetical protein GCM10007148_10910 [Parvularcula lutaonensis]
MAGPVKSVVVETAAAGLPLDLASSHSLKPGATQPMTEARMPSPVTDQIRTAIEARGPQQRIEVQLDPPELGRVQIEFEVSRSGSLRAIITASEMDTADLLRRHGGSFAEDLRDQGFEDVDLAWGDDRESDPAPYATPPDLRAASPQMTVGHARRDSDALLDIQL